MTTETAQPGMSATGEQVKIQELSVWGALKANMRDYGLLLALILIMLFFQYFTNGVLFKPVNLTNIILQNSYIIVMALGMLLVIVAGHIDLNIRKGEVVGIAGLMGSGRTEFAMSVFGKSYGQRISGQVLLHGKPIDTSTVEKAVGHGIAYATEDRKTYGLNLIDHIKHNTTIANLGGVSRVGVIDDLSEMDVANEYRKKTNIRSSSVYQVTGNLSGGNQQKVVLSKWLFANPDVLILDEPTRGIDVGAKYEIYTIINQLAAQGKAILVISSEMPELLGITDRIYVMNEGRIVGEMPTSEASQEKIMRSIVRAEGKAS